jgi:hypothetical protein
MASPSRELKIVFSHPEGGCDTDRLSMALSMLISEKDVIDFLNDQQELPDHPSPQSLAASHSATKTVE